MTCLLCFILVFYLKFVSLQPILYLFLFSAKIFFLTVRRVGYKIPRKQKLGLLRIVYRCLILFIITHTKSSVLLKKMIYSVQVTEPMIQIYYNLNSYNVFIIKNITIRAQKFIKPF